MFPYFIIVQLIFSGSLESKKIRSYQEVIQSDPISNDLIRGCSE